MSGLSYKLATCHAWFVFIIYSSQALKWRQERLARNPLASNELERLENYYRRLRSGSILNYEEVEDYNRLVAILQKERPTEPGIWHLVALGAFMVGLMIGRREER